MRRTGYFLGLLLLFTMLSACAWGSALYGVPETAAPGEMQGILAQDIGSGLQYLAPGSGQWKQPLQWVDLNGDGEQEAIAFFRDPRNAGLAVRVYSAGERGYTLHGEITCKGSAFDSVDYADLNGDGKKEIILLAELGAATPKTLWVFRYGEQAMEPLLSTACGALYTVDLNGNNTWELLCISRDDHKAVVDYYHYGDAEMTDERLVIDGAYESIQGVRQGVLMDGSRVVLVSLEQEENELLTEIFTAADGAFVRVELDDPLLKTSGLNGRFLLPQDINGDGHLEIPKVAELPAYSPGSAPQYITQWYSLDRFGGNVLQEITYHSLSGGWYFSIPESWLGNILARETDLAEGNENISIVTFYRTDGDGKPQEEQFAVYTLRGENRQSYAESAGLMILYSDSQQLLAIRFNDHAKTWNGSLTVSQISERFHRMIDSDDDEWK